MDRDLSAGAAGRAPGLLTAYLLTVEVMLYFVSYLQQSTSLTLFALRNVDPEFRLGGTVLFSLSAGQFQALNPLWIMILSPAMVWTYSMLGRRGRDLSIAIKFLFGFVLVTAAFLVWWAATGRGAPARISPWIMVAGYGLTSLGELLVGALGIAVVARYTPVRLGAFMIGAFTLGIGIAFYIGSAVANLASLPPGLLTAGAAQSLPIYHRLFLNLLELSLVVTALCAALLPLLRFLDRAHHAGLAGRADKF